MGYLEMALNKLDAGESLTEKDRGLIEIPFRSLQSSAELIATLRNMKKIKTANILMEKLDLGEVVTGVVNDIASVPGRAINIHYKPVHNCWVEANYLLKEVFINLIGNAIKHSYGPMDIGIGIGTVTSNGNKYYAVTVEDNGPGMPDSIKSQMLSRHYCEEEKNLSKGAGLCLVKALVERFQGKVTVEDRVPGDHTKGARFVVLLPVVEK
jgi:signal transduction histidine kinase